MKVVAVCACPTGVAHTYMAKSALEQAANKLGHEIKVEAQGALGIENEITQEEVESADVVILAIEVGIAKMERFDNKPTVKVAIQSAIKSSEALLQKVEEKLNSR